MASNAPSFADLCHSLPPLDILKSHSDDYARQGSEAKTAIAALRAARRLLIEWVYNQPEDALEKIYFTEISGYTGLFISSEFALHNLDFEESAILNQLMAHLTQGGLPPVQLSVMALLLRPAYKMPMIDLDAIPSWFVKEFMFYITRSFKLLRSQNCLKALEHNFQRYMEQLKTYPQRNPARHLPLTLYYQYLIYASFINIYAAPAATSPIWSQRADLMEDMLRLSQGALAGPIALQPNRPAQYRIGILAADFAASAEGYFALSHWHDLPRDKFHLTLFSMVAEPHGLELYARSKVDTYIALNCRFADTDDLKRVVDQIRAARLDILMIATNTSASLHSTTLTSAHRLARIQIMNTATPITTGHRAMDGYLSADFNERPDGQADYTEQLLTLPGSVNYYAYHFDHQGPSQAFTKQYLGLPEDKVLIFAGGNFFKLTPDTLRIWARLLARCPQAHLVMMPFSPGWLGGVMPAGPMLDVCQEIFVAEGANPAALTLIPPSQEPGRPSSDYGVVRSVY